MSVWIRVEASPDTFRKIRDVIDLHLARETTCAATWTPIDAPVAYSRPIAARWVKRWREQAHVLDGFHGHLASVERLERALNAIVPRVGSEMVVEYKQGGDMLFVIDLVR